MGYISETETGLICFLILGPDEWDTVQPNARLRYTISSQEDADQEREILATCFHVI